MEDNSHDVDDINAHGAAYLAKVFPIGSSVLNAVSEMKEGGADCYSVADRNDTINQKIFVCDFGDSGYGLNRFFENIDWMIGLYFDVKTGIITFLSASREETSF